MKITSRSITSKRRMMWYLLQIHTNAKFAEAPFTQDFFNEIAY